MERQNNPEAASEARAPAVVLRRVRRWLSGGLQDGLLVVATLAALLGVSLGMSALVRWLSL